MIARWISERLKKSLERVPVVFLLEPRQTGQTTYPMGEKNQAMSLVIALDAQWGEGKTSNN